MNSSLRQIIIDLATSICGTTATMALLYFLTGFTPAPLEMIGVTANVWGMLLIRKQNIFGWIACVIAMVCIGIFSIQMQIYGQAFLQLGYFLPSVLYALYIWRKQAQDNQPPQWLTNKQRALTCLLFLAFLVPAYLLIEGKHGPLLHLADVIGITFIMTANILMVLKKKDCWLIFAPGNLFIIFLFTMTGGYMVALLNIFFLINGLIAFWQWTKEDRKRSRKGEIDQGSAPHPRSLL